MPDTGSSFEKIQACLIALDSYEDELAASLAKPNMPGHSLTDEQVSRIKAAKKINAYAIEALTAYAGTIVAIRVNKESQAAVAARIKTIQGDDASAVIDDKALLPALITLEEAEKARLEKELDELNKKLGRATPRAQSYINVVRATNIDVATPRRVEAETETELTDSQNENPCANMVANPDPLLDVQ